MSIWLALGLGLLFSYLAFLLRPKPKAPPPSTIEDSDVPVVNASDPIPRIYGTVWIKSPNVVWYGDLRTTPIRKSEDFK